MSSNIRMNLDSFFVKTFFFAAAGGVIYGGVYLFQHKVDQVESFCFSTKNGTCVSPILNCLALESWRNFTIGYLNQFCDLNQKLCHPEGSRGPKTIGDHIVKAIECYPHTTIVGLLGVFMFVLGCLICVLGLLIRVDCRSKMDAVSLNRNLFIGESLHSNEGLLEEGYSALAA